MPYRKPKIWHRQLPHPPILLHNPITLLLAALSNNRTGCIYGPALEKDKGLFHCRLKGDAWLKHRSTEVHFPCLGRRWTEIPRCPQPQLRLETSCQKPTADQMAPMCPWARPSDLKTLCGCQGNHSESFEVGARDRCCNPEQQRWCHGLTWLLITGNFWQNFHVQMVRGRSFMGCSFFVCIINYNEALNTQWVHWYKDLSPTKPIKIFT